MRVKTEHAGDTLIVRLEGELDMHTVHVFRTEVDRWLDHEMSLKHLVLLFDAVDFVDSAGLAAILGRYRKLQARGGKVVAAGLRPQVRKVFEFSGLLNVIEVSQTEHQALGRVRV